jgi:cellulose biosynthesis protein BcsQ/tetratricopeptide (TPR) repeat protein
MSSFVRAPKRGHVTTFYSYKGGVGRTALLANVAHLLARWGRRVLCLDWDLEAPGLKRYLERDDRDGPGTLDLLLGSLDGGPADWRAMRRPVPGPWRGEGRIDFIDVGRHQSCRDEYIDAVLALDFSEMAKKGLNLALEAMRADWLTEYDHVLIDSRTGVTDVGGICAAQLPDLLVLCVNMNAQSIDGSADVVRRAKAVRSRLPVERGSFQVLPVPCKVTVGMESELEDRWERRFLDVMGEHLLRALPPEPGLGLLQALVPQLRVPWQARWAHGEGLPVDEERLDEPGSTAWGMANIAAMVDTELLHIGALLDQPGLARPVGGAASRGELISKLGGSVSAVPPNVEAVKALQAARGQARSLVARGDAQRAVELLEGAIGSAAGQLGAEHREVLNAVRDLAGIFSKRGEHGKAMPILERLWEATARAVGEAHPDAIDALAALTDSLWALGEYGQVRTKEEQLLKVRRQTLGPAHPDTLSAMGNLAGTMFAQGDHVGARAAFEEVLEVRRRTLGPEHPDTLSAIADVATSVFEQGDHAGARALEEEVLKVRRRTLGPEHPDTLNAMADLALTIKAQADHAGARALEEEALDGLRRALGPAHPDTLHLMGYLADTLEALGEHAQAAGLRAEVFRASTGGG